MKHTGIQAVLKGDEIKDSNVTKQIKSEFGMKFEIYCIESIVDIGMIGNIYCMVIAIFGGGLLIYQSNNGLNMMLNVCLSHIFYFFFFLCIFFIFMTCLWL